MTLAQQSRLRGADANLRVRGRTMIAMPGNERLRVLVTDQPNAPLDGMIPTDDLPVFTHIHALTGSLVSPRGIQTMTEEETGKVWQVLEFVETSGDLVWWDWTCEAERLTAPDSV